MRHGLHILGQGRHSPERVRLPGATGVAGSGMVPPFGLLLRGNTAVSQATPQGMLRACKVWRPRTAISRALGLCLTFPHAGNSVLDPSRLEPEKVRGTFPPLCGATLAFFIHRGLTISPASLVQRSDPFLRAHGMGGGDQRQATQHQVIPPSCQLKPAEFLFHNFTNSGRRHETPEAGAMGFPDASRDRNHKKKITYTSLDIDCFSCVRSPKSN